MPSSEIPFEPPHEPSEKEQLRKLVENGYAYDTEGAQDALLEQQEAEMCRAIDREQGLAERREELVELDRRAHDPTAEPLSGDEAFDRYDLRYRIAVIEAGETPDELEYLYYCYQLDVFNSSPVPLEDNIQARRLECDGNRLRRRSRALEIRIGEDRANEVFSVYRARLGELFQDYM